jgi:hypothetical protein
MMAMVADGGQTMEFSELPLTGSLNSSGFSSKKPLLMLSKNPHVFREVL